MSPASKDELTVLALDPGYDRLGVAVIKREQGREVVKFSTCLTSQKTNSFPNRLAEIGRQLEDLIKEWQPNLVALETLFFSTNRKTASAVAETRGVILYLAAKAQASICELNPQSIKLAVTGYGKADKAQVQNMVKRLVKLSTIQRHDDEYDAIAIGLAALSTYIS